MRSSPLGTMKMSPRKTMKGRSMVGSHWSTAWAMPSGSGWTTYSMRTPKRAPSPKKVRTLSSSGLTTMRTSSMPMARMASSWCSAIGLLHTGSSGLGIDADSGRSRAPVPAARMTPMMPPRSRSLMPGGMLPHRDWMTRRRYRATLSRR